jgi:hypothetical protein
MKAVVMKEANKQLTIYRVSVKSLSVFFLDISQVSGTREFLLVPKDRGKIGGDFGDFYQVRQGRTWSRSYKSPSPPPSPSPQNFGLFTLYQFCHFFDNFFDNFFTTFFGNFWQFFGNF